MSNSTGRRRRRRRRSRTAIAIGRTSNHTTLWYFSTRPKEEQNVEKVKNNCRKKYEKGAFFKRLATGVQAN
jgi:hypothetical protein